MAAKTTIDSFDENKIVVNHFTAGFILNNLKENDEEFNKKCGNRIVKDVISQNVSKNKGFASAVIQCKIIFVDSKTDDDVYTTILKIPGVEEFKKAFGETLDYDEKIYEKFLQVHESECDFYELLAKYVDIPVPKMYKTLPWTPGKEDGVIQMEDLSSKASVMLGQFNLTQVKCIVRHIAHMHRKILCLDEKLWKGKFIKNQTIYDGESIPKALDRFYEYAKHDDYFEKTIKKYLKFVTNTDFYHYAFGQSWKDLKMMPVLVHNDMWSGNIMWQLNEFGDPTTEIVAFVDWQILHEGSPMADFSRLLTICTGGFNRRKFETIVFDYYLECLTKEMAEERKSCPYTLEQVQENYYIMFLTQAFVPIIGTVITGDYLMKNDSEKLRKAKVDEMLLKCKHILEDVDELLTGKLSYLFERFGV
uniref:CHK kinase-like domain-containing protein n=2 Tax=Panagrolaimus sp. JU765 TaxID=591449 RepID=A0AC34QCN9_9BILA